MGGGGGWQLPFRLSTCIIIEHSKAVSVMVPEELPCDHPMVLLDHLQVLLVEALPEPRFVPCLLKEPRGHVTNNVHLREGVRRRGSGTPSSTLSSPLKTCLSPQRQADRLKRKQTDSNAPPPLKSLPSLSQADSGTLYTAMNIPHAAPPLCLCTCYACHLEHLSHFHLCKSYQQFNTRSKGTSSGNLPGPSEVSLRPLESSGPGTKPSLPGCAAHAMW